MRRGQLAWAFVALLVVLALVPAGAGAQGGTTYTVQPGDSLTVYVDSATRQMQKVVASTTFQENPVTITATFASLPGGPTYPAFAEVVVPAKGYDLKVQNFNYQKNGM